MPFAVASGFFLPRSAGRQFQPVKERGGKRKNLSFNLCEGRAGEGTKKWGKQGKKRVGERVWREAGVQRDQMEKAALVGRDVRKRTKG